MIKTLFLGSNYEALETLRALNENDFFNIVGVITQPDKPVGRKKEVVVTDIKRYCLDNNLEVFHTEGKKENYERVIKKLKPDLVVCKSFGEIVPDIVLDFPKFGAINIHFSLLPKYRGAVPIQKALLDGEKETGITIIKMNRVLDGGDILAKKPEVILDTDTNVSLRKKLVKQVPDFLIDVLKKWVNNDINPEKQNEDDVTFCWKRDINKDVAKIDFENHSAIYIERMVRAFVPWPVAWFFLNSKKTKVFDINIDFSFFLEPKKFKILKNKLYIGSKDGNIVIKKLQIEGKRVMDIREFLNGGSVISIQ